MFTTLVLLASLLYAPDGPSVRIHIDKTVQSPGTTYSQPQEASGGFYVLATTGPDCRIQKFTYRGSWVLDRQEPCGVVFLASRGRIYIAADRVVSGYRVDGDRMVALGKSTMVQEPVVSMANSASKLAVLTRQWVRYFSPETMDYLYQESNTKGLVALYGVTETTLVGGDSDGDAIVLSIPRLWSSGEYSREFLRLQQAVGKGDGSNIVVRSPNELLILHGTSTGYDLQRVQSTEAGKLAMNMPWIVSGNRLWYNNLSGVSSIFSTATDVAISNEGAFLTVTNDSSSLNFGTVSITGQP